MSGVGVLDKAVVILGACVESEDPANYIDVEYGGSEIYIVGDQIENRPFDKTPVKRDVGAPAWPVQIEGLPRQIEPWVTSRARRVDLGN